jgi:ATP-dependent DNA ligase
MLVPIGTHFHTLLIHKRACNGTTAKLPASRYLPGKRSLAWRKIKPTELVPYVIISYRAACLLVATVRQGVLRYMGRLTRGLGASSKTELVGRLAGAGSSRNCTAG